MKTNLLLYTAACVFFIQILIVTSGDSTVIDFRKFISAPINGSSSRRFLRDESEERLIWETQNRTKRFFGLTSGAYGNNLQLGLSFVVPFLNIPLGGGLTGTPYYNGDPTSFYGTSAHYNGGAYGSPYNALGLGGSGVILPVLLAIGAIIFIPYLLNSFTGLQTSPYGRSDDMQEMINNLWIQVENSLHERNIDITSCLQKVICQRASEFGERTLETEENSETVIGKILDFLITNPFFNSLVEGTQIHEALVVGKQSESRCFHFANKCPYSWDSIYSGLVSFALEAYNVEASEENLAEA